MKTFALACVTAAAAGYTLQQQQQQLPLVLQCEKASTGLTVPLELDGKSIARLDLANSMALVNHEPPVTGFQKGGTRYYGFVTLYKYTGGQARWTPQTDFFTVSVYASYWEPLITTLPYNTVGFGPYRPDSRNTLQKLQSESLFSQWAQQNGAEEIFTLYYKQSNAGWLPHIALGAAAPVADAPVGATTVSKGDTSTYAFYVKIFYDGKIVGERNLKMNTVNDQYDMAYSELMVLPQDLYTYLKTAVNPKESSSSCHVSDFYNYKDIELAIRIQEGTDAYVILTIPASNYMNEGSPYDPTSTICTLGKLFISSWSSTQYFISSGFLLHSLFAAQFDPINRTIKWGAIPGTNVSVRVGAYPYPDPVDPADPVQPDIAVFTLATTFASFAVSIYML